MLRRFVALYYMLHMLCMQWKKYAEIWLYMRAARCMHHMAMSQFPIDVGTLLALPHHLCCSYWRFAWILTKCPLLEHIPSLPSTFSITMVMLHRYHALYHATSFHPKLPLPMLANPSPSLPSTFSITMAMLHWYHPLSHATSFHPKLPLPMLANPSSNRPPSANHLSNCPPYLSIECPLSASFLHSAPPTVTISLLSRYLHLRRSIQIRSPNSISTKKHLYSIGGDGAQGIESFRRSMLPRGAFPRSVLQRSMLQQILRCEFSVLFFWWVLRIYSSFRSVASASIA